MGAVGNRLSNQPILVIAGSIDPAAQKAVDRLRALPHISPVMPPPTPVALGQIPTPLIAAQVWQVFQNGDDCLLGTALAPDAIADLERAVQEAGRDLQWAKDQITGWLAAVARHALGRIARPASLVLAGDGVVQAMLTELRIRRLEPFRGGGPGVDVQVAPGSALRVVSAPSDLHDPDVLVRAVETLRTLDADQPILRPYF